MGFNSGFKGLTRLYPVCQKTTMLAILCLIRKTSI